MSPEPQATVSTVITTYYRNSMLEDAIESVRSQTYNDIEIIVVDDSGKRHAAPVAEDMPGVEYIPLEENQGPHAARSVGAQAATGDYIQFLDDDDILREDKFEQQLPHFSDKVGVVYSAVQIYETGEIKHPEPDAHGEVIEKALKVRLRSPVCTCSLLTRAELIKAILPLKNRHGCDDDGLELELALQTHFAAVDEPLVTLRKDTEYSVGGLETTIQGRWAMLDVYSYLYEKAPPEVRRTVLFDIHRLKAERALKESHWSLTAIVNQFLAAYYAPENKTKRIGVAISSIFGTKGIETASRLFEHVME